MRETLLIALLLTSILSFGGEKEDLPRIGFLDAVNQGIIKYSLTGSRDKYDTREYVDANGLYYGKCMAITLQSSVDSSFIVELESGLMMISEDTSVQNMVLTKTVLGLLKDNDLHTYLLYAMCAEYHDLMPTKGVEYQVIENDDDEMVELVKTIEKNYLQNMIGQSALWAYTDNLHEKDLRDLGATDHSIEHTIDILNKTGIHTNLNQMDEQDSLAVNLITEQLEHKESKDEEDKSYFKLSSRVVFSAIGLIFLLIATNIFQYIKNKKRLNK